MLAKSPTAAILWACLQRDVRIALTYRLALILRFLGTFFQVIVFFFISPFLGGGAHPALAGYEGGYFAYVLIGLAFQRLFALSLSGYANSLSEMQQTGTLEAQALLPTSLPLLVVGSNLWPGLYALSETLIYLGLGAALGASLAGANALAALLLSLMASLAISGLGLMGAALILLFKRGNAVAWGVEAAVVLLAGVYFPADLLPAPLPRLALILPHTHAFAGLRAALLQGAGLETLLPTLVVLALFALILLPAGLFSLLWAQRLARQRGTIAQY